MARKGSPRRREIRARLALNKVYAALRWTTDPHTLGRLDWLIWGQRYDRHFRSNYDRNRYLNGFDDEKRAVPEHLAARYRLKGRLGCK